MAFAKSKNFNYGYPTPGPQSPTTNDVMNHVFFLTKEDWKEARETGKYDYIIIGSGFCGYAFAERVLRNEPEAKILVIERGNYFLPAHFQNLPLPYANLLLAGAAETFPWTLSNETRRGTYLQWQHGMIPFFGGRSILWSAWCPEPTREEMNGWPQETYEILRPAKGKGYFDSAHDLLNVTPADQIDKDVVANPQLLNLVQSKRPVYSNLQDSLYKRLAAVAPHKIGTIYRVEPARLAVGSKKDLSLDFYKYSVAAPILEIIKQYKDRKGQGVFHVVTDCVVSKIIHQAEPAVKPATEKEGTKEKKQKNPNQAKKPKAPAECVAKATALHTSRGVVPIGDQTKLIIAAGAIPSATLAMNSFPDLVEKHNFGKRLTAHFITAIVAKIPRDKFPGGDKISDLELAAVYVAGAKQEKKGEHEKSEVIHGLVGQYHIQLTALYDSQPESNADTGLRYMPDVVATASAEQLATSKGSVVLVCAVLGEIDSRNTNNWIRINPHDPDPTSNITLQLTTNGLDKETWDRMDNDTFALIESITEGGAKDVTYWLQETSDKGYWLPQGESLKKHVNTYRVSGTVHEGSPLYLGTENDNSSPVNSKDYKLRGTDNVYVTGAGLWPESASWNPTMTMVGLAQHLADNLQKPPAQDTAPEGGDRAERQKDHRNHMYQRANEQQRSNGVTLGHYSFTGIGQAVERKQEF